MPKHTRVLLVGAAFTVLLLVSACGPLPDLRNPRLLSDLSLISGTPCDAPCWNGLTPGVTPWRDAVIAIQDDARFADVRTQGVQGSVGGELLEFRPAEGEVCCQLATQQGDVLDVVLLRYAPGITLTQVIDRYGGPTYLIGSEYREDQAVVNLVYPDTPMLVVVVVAGLQAGVLAPDNDVVGSVYMAEDDMALLLQTSNLYAWDGFQAYNLYAVEDYAVTPSVTLTPASE